MPDDDLTTLRAILAAAVRLEAALTHGEMVLSPRARKWLLKAETAMQTLTSHDDSVSVEKGKIECPHCKNNVLMPVEEGPGLRHVDDLPIGYAFKYARPDGALVFDVTNTYPYNEETHSGRFECRHCLREFPIPADIDVEFE